MILQDAKQRLDQKSRKSLLGELATFMARAMFGAPADGQRKRRAKDLPRHLQQDIGLSDRSSSSSSFDDKWCDELRRLRR
ncbi:hypothetical protein SAMN06265374_3411 [Roseibium denhamense]|uniref:DUF2191 domain-containing protein n=1 Tax=Roseibium denhamense TaxID=76305 RepID=A0ABY1PCM0_9HYPH|nr:hypothetical protein SAMN06265374_3411 [Roseibium denhamense]